MRSIKITSIAFYSFKSVRHFYRYALGTMLSGETDCLLVFIFVVTATRRCLRLPIADAEPLFGDPNGGNHQRGPN